ncbi:C1 peptidase-like protein [Aureococcus anophagefferens]|nr:C1 peptidase-like protein [Aureococcus anophagefferens]
MDFYVHGVMGCPSDKGDCEAGSIDEHKHCDPDTLDVHALLVGYGEQDGLHYWVVKNAWGDMWGEDGDYRVVRGVNHCGIANFATHSADFEAIYDHEWAKIDQSERPQAEHMLTYFLKTKTAALLAYFARDDVSPLTKTEVFLALEQGGRPSVDSESDDDDDEEEEEA